MKKLLKHDFYTPEELSKEWTKSTQEDISIDKIYHYGKEGRLNFMVSNPDDNSLHATNDPGDDYIQVFLEKDMNESYWVKYFSITTDELNYILAGNSLKLDSYEELIDGKKATFLISPTIRYQYDKSSLRISGKEVSRFEAKYFKEFAKELNVLDNDIPTWKDLFINPPTKETLVFANICAAVTSYIEKYLHTPSREQLWEHLKTKFKYDEGKKVFEGISGVKMDRQNYRKNFKRWTSEPQKMESQKDI